MKKNTAISRRILGNLIGTLPREKEHDFEHYDETVRLKFVNISLLTGFFISCAVLCFQILRHAFPGVYFSAASAVLFFVFILLMRRSRNIKLGSVFLLSFIVVLTGIGLTSSETFTPGMLFFFSYPVIAFYLQGTRRGVWWVFVFSCVYGAALLLITFGVISGPVPHPIPLIGLLNIVLISIFTFLSADRHRRIEALMRKQIFSDALTGLPNRKKLIKDIDHSVSPALFLVNVDDFKEINAIFGYRIGDSVLIFLGKLISHILPTYARGVYRLAGDEFAVLVDTADEFITRDMLETTATLLSQYVQRERYGYAKYEIMLRVTTGIALSENTGKQNLFSCADIALKTAKQLRKPFLFYSDAQKTRSRFKDNLKWLKILSNAIEGDRIFPFYQPIVTNATGKIEKYECLARIADSEGKIILPKNFLEIAKKSRLYPKITRAMLKKTFETFRNIDTEFSLNLSIEDFFDPYLLQYIKIALNESPSISKKVTFEILESEGIKNYGELSTFIEEMKQLGCKIALDDFGTGYSNFEYLIKLNLDYLKIDGSLIRKLDRDDGTKIIVENIVNFSKKLGIQTVAEYVHSDEIFSIVKELGIDYSQGILLGEPRPAMLNISDISTSTALSSNKTKPFSPSSARKE
jgi:diguanylate cyclase (GGDEF)-like protein